MITILLCIAAVHVYLLTGVAGGLVAKRCGYDDRPGYEAIGFFWPIAVPIIALWRYVEFLGRLPGKLDKRLTLLWDLHQNSKHLARAQTIKQKKIEDKPEHHLIR